MSLSALATVAMINLSSEKFSLLSATHDSARKRAKNANVFILVFLFWPRSVFLFSQFFLSMRQKNLLNFFPAFTHDFFSLAFTILTARKLVNN